MAAEGGLKGLAEPQPADPAAKKRIVIVLAMHRSGSSMITRALKALGVELGDRLMPAREGENDTGFWEDLDFFELNEKLLARAGRRWDALEPVESESLAGAAFSDLRREAGVLLSRKTDGSAIFGFKDPRTVLLLPFWHCVLEDLDFDPCYVIPVRNPLEVAASLSRRNGFEMEKGVALWAKHMIEAVRRSQGHPRVFVDYTVMIDDPLGELERMAAVLDLPVPGRTSEEACEFAGDFVSRSLRHNIIGRGEIARSGVAPDYVCTLYDEMRRLSRLEAGTPDTDVVAGHWTAIEEGFAAALPLLRHIDQLTLRLEALEQQKSELASGLDVRAGALAEALAAQAGLASELAAARARLEQAEIRETALTAELSDSRKDTEVSLRRVSEFQQELVAARQWADKTAAERSAQEAALAQERAYALKVISDLERDLKREQLVSLERHRALGAALADAHAVRTSTTWKLGAPVRRLSRMAPSLTRAGRRALKLVWWTLTLQVGARLQDRMTARNANPATTTGEAARSAGPASAKPAHPEPLTGKHGYTPFDPRPIARMLSEDGQADGHTADWLAHCEAFPLPFQPDARKQDPVILSDAAARDWIARCAEAGRDLGEDPARPDVTIIVPVYNQLAFTLSVIASVYRWRSRYSYEILLADDGSADQTRWLDDQSLPRVRVLHNPENLGFLRNCNNAAAHARGRHLVLLNNDTIVLPGWLDELVDTLESDPAIGLVGSKLLFPDATVQEAGGIVWRDGSAWNYGRGSNPRDPYLSFRRDCDYCSGASIALRRSDWEALGGFDAGHYENAYYEDTDLAFRVRAAGKRVVVQPLSRLVHFEGISSGTDTGEGVKKYQVTNGERFFKRWTEVLATHRPNGEAPELERERTVTRRLLVIDTVTPTPDRDAGSLITCEMMDAFQAQGWRVSFVPEDNFACISPQTQALQRAGIEALYWPFYTTMEEVLEKRGHEFDAVLIFRVTSTRKHLDLIARCMPGKPVLFHVADLHHLRERREAELKGDAALLKASRQTERDEIEAVRKSDVTIVHSDSERDILQQLVPGAAVYVFPWIAEAAAAPPGPRDRRGMVFVGGFNHPPNADAVLWFASQVWPRVLARRPDASLRVIGPNAPPSVEALHGQDQIEVLGWVPDLEPYLDAARLSIAPLRYGAGVKGKVVSSLAAGLPVVATGIAAEGMGLAGGVEAEIADTPEDMAAAILRLLDDDAAWAGLSEAGRAFVERNYSRARARERVGEILKIAGL